MTDIDNALDGAVTRAVELGRVLKLTDPNFAVKILAFPAEFVLGLAESDGDVGVTFDDPESGRSIAYDLGRGLGRAGRMGEDDDTIGVVLTRRHYGEGYRR